MAKSGKAGRVISNGQVAFRLNGTKANFVNPPEKQQERSRGRVTSDLGRWGMVMEWLYESDLSDGAIALYALLGIYADQELKSFPSRKVLADRMGVSADTVDRRIKELVSVGALRVTQRKSRKNEWHSNVYKLIRVKPEG